jgi:myo-inositol 2-dehydrogenase/D-chiro-inositol 1-dehydrogenase
MRIAVIGAGRMGAIRVEDLAADSRVDEVIVTNRNPERADQLAARFGARAVPWADRDQLDADATVVALATDAHGDLLHAVLTRGRPVLCEKPIALTLEQTAEVIELAGRSGAPLQIGFQRRFDPGLQAMRAAVSGGHVGVLYSMSLISHDHAPSSREFIAGSGGIFRDLHVHDADLIRWITGSEIASVYATQAVRAHTDYAEFGDADVTVIHVVTESGVQAVIRGARHDALGHDVRVELHGSQDSLTAGLTGRTPLRALDGSLPVDVDPYTGFVDRFREAFRRETSSFVDLVRGDIENPCPPDSALESLRVAIACEESVRTGRAVAVADIA